MVLTCDIAWQSSSERAERGLLWTRIRRLFFGFGKTMPVSERWRKLCGRTITGMDSMRKEIADMQRLLQDMMAKCQCETVEQCGRGIFRADLEGKSWAMNRVPNRKIRTK